MAGKKLLVADDSLTIQKVIRLALSNEGYEIHAVSDGNDAIQQISLFRPDVVLIDVSLPGKTAFEVKRAINEHDDLEDIRFVLMSSAFEKFDEAQAQEVEFHGRLTKPFDPANLREILNQVIAQITAKQKEPTSFLNRPAPTPPMAPPSMDDPVEQLSPDADIRQLTESTIRMSGLDDYQWNVQEPSLKPPSEMQDAGDSNFSLDTSLGTTAAAASYHNAPDASPDSMPMDSHEIPIPPSFNADALPESRALTDIEMEVLIQLKVEETVKKLAQTLLPQVAERIIKQEIHRLLSEQP